MVKVLVGRKGGQDRAEIRVGKRGLFALDERSRMRGRRLERFEPAAGQLVIQAESRTRFDTDLSRNMFSRKE